MSSLSSSSSASNLLPLLVIYRSDASSASATVTQQGSNTLTNNESINGSLIGEADDNLDKNPKNTNKNGDEQIDSNGTSDDLPSIHIPKTLPRGYFQTRVTADSEEVVKLVKLGLSSATPPNVIIIEHDDGLEASRNRALSVIDFIRGDSAISITNSTNSGDAGVPENNSFLMASSNHSKNETVLSSSFNSTSKKDGASKRPQQHQQQQRQQQRHNNQNARSNHSKNSGGKGTTSNPLSEFHHAHHLKEVANFKKRILIILWSKSASRNIMEHTYWTNRGVNMISNSITSVEKAISMAHYLSLKEISNRWVLFNCTYCNQKLSLNKLHLHLPLLHGIENDISSGCPVCHEKTHNIFTHFLDAHPKEGSIGGSTNDWENLFSLKRKNKDEYSGNDAAELTAKDLKSLKISFAAAAAAPKTSSSSSSGSINSSLGDLHIPVFVLVVCRKPKDGKFLLVDELSNKVGA